MVDSLRSFWNDYGQDAYDFAQGSMEGYQEEERPMPGYDPTMFNEHMMRLNRLPAVQSPLPGIEWFGGGY
jgi:hypothetical protein